MCEDFSGFSAFKKPWKAKYMNSVLSMKWNCDITLNPFKKHLQSCLSRIYAIILHTFYGLLTRDALPNQALYLLPHFFKRV